MHAVIADEGRNEFAIDASTIRGRSPLSDLQGMGRSMQIAFYVATNALRLTDEGLRSNTFLPIAFRPANGEDAMLLQRVLNLTDEQTAYLSTMPRGEAIVKLAGQPAFLATFDPLPANADEASYERARARTREFLLAAREAVTGQQPAFPAPPRLLPAAGLPETSPNRIALNTNEEKLLRFIGEHKVVLTTECDLHPQQLTRAKQKLLTLGMITEERITARSGRGGQASALAPTPSGCAWLRLTPGGAGGGGLQHQYLVRKLIENIPGAQREVSLDGKRVDVLFTATSEHAWLRNALGIALNTGDHIAIEVEVSDPTKTAPSNLAKNRAAGVTHTIIAVLPADVERTRAALPGTIVVNIFDLLRGGP